MVTIYRGQVEGSQTVPTYTKQELRSHTGTACTGHGMGSHTGTTYIGQEERSHTVSIYTGNGMGSHMVTPYTGQVEGSNVIRGNKSIVYRVLGSIFPGSGDFTIAVQFCF